MTTQNNDRSLPATFAGMIRELPAVVTHFCQHCMKRTSHEIEERGEWETHRCKECAMAQDYRVR